MMFSVINFIQMILAFMHVRSHQTEEFNYEYVDTDGCKDNE